MMESDYIAVKLLTKGSDSHSEAVPFLNHFPKKNPTWGRCRFVSAQAKEYDWLVIYDDTHRPFAIDCPKGNSLLVTVEPSSIKIYESAYLKQFGYVLSGQEDWALRHKGKIHAQPALLWHYDHKLDYDAIASRKDFKKTKCISTVCSAKQQRHTEHQQRYHFTKQAQQALSELDWYGRGVRSIDEKSQALDAYRYHIAIENHACPHWWTEKLADAFLGQALPFYYGASNLSEYFPEESYIAIDINRPEEAIRIIKDAIRNDEYNKRLPHLKEARRRIIEDYHLFATLARIIESKQAYSAEPEYPWIFENRHTVRKKFPNLIPCLYEKTRGKILTQINRHSHHH